MGLFWGKKQDKVSQPPISASPANLAVTDFRMNIQDVFDMGEDGKAIMGEVLAGTVSLGDIVFVNGEVLQIIRFENLTRFTPPTTLANPLPWMLLESFGGSVTTDLAAATMQLENAVHDSTNTTSNGNQGETVSLLLHTKADRESLKGATVFKVVVPLQSPTGVAQPGRGQPS